MTLQRPSSMILLSLCLTLNVLLPMGSHEYSIEQPSAYIFKPILQRCLTLSHHNVSWHTFFFESSDL